MILNDNIDSAAERPLTAPINETMHDNGARLSSGQVAIKIFGEDLDEIDRTAQDVARVVSSVRGAADVQVEAQPGLPEMVVQLRPERLV